MKRLLVSLMLAMILLPGCSSTSAPELSEQATPQLDELVIMAHGLGRGQGTMKSLEYQIRAAGYQVCSIDYDSVGMSIEYVRLASKIAMDNCMVPAKKVHFVGHSLGGLMVRNYLAYYPDFLRDFTLGEVVLLATPNKGSEVADEIREGPAIYFLGGVGQALVTGDAGFAAQLPEPDYAPGVIAGSKSLVPTDPLFSGLNDGLVSVESTKLDNMKDFMLVYLGHSGMRRNAEIGRQTIHFLQYGRFSHIKS